MVCRVFFRAFGKEALCRVPNKKHSAKKRFAIVFLHLIKSFFVECFLTLGKELFCLVFFYTRKRATLPNVFFDARQR
jgi:hypothetical protein